MIKATAEVIGAKPFSADALDIMRRELADYSDNDILCALSRCGREIKADPGFQPVLTLPQILERIPGVVTEAAKIDAEPLAAWDLVLQLRKYHLQPVSGAAGEGQYEMRDAVVNDFSRYPDAKNVEELFAAHFEATGHREVPARAIVVPRIPKRITDSIHRIGGWARIAQMTGDTEHWVKRDFIGEYVAWTAVEAVIDFGKALATGERIHESVKALAEKKAMP